MDWNSVFSLHDEPYFDSNLSGYLDLTGFPHIMEKLENNSNFLGLEKTTA